jgi:Fibrinogen beta and gamma chains, C-terminal globular domain
MGNENIYMLTNNEDYALRIELEDFEGNKRSLPMKFKALKLFSIFFVNLENVN